MASMWVKVVTGGFMAAVVGSAIGKLVPIKQSASTGEKSRAIAATPPERTSVETRRQVPKEKAPDDYPIVRQASAMSAKGDGLSLLLNLGGELCADVISTQHMNDDRFEVTCSEYRGGSAVARYSFDAATGKAKRLG